MAAVGDDLPVSDPAAHPLHAPFDAVVVALPRGPTSRSGAGAAVVVLEAMKMEHEVLADVDGVVRELAVVVGEAVTEGQLLATLEPRAVVGRRGRRARRRSAGRAGGRAGGPAGGPRAPRDRPRRSASGGGPSAATRAAGARPGRTSRTSCDPDTFEEYGPLLFAAQRAPPQPRGADRPHPGRRARGRHRRGQRDLFEDGRVRRLSYDYSVLAGTQGQMQPPQEGPPLRARRAACGSRSCCSPRAAAGRPGDTDMAVVTGLDYRGLRAVRRASAAWCPLVGDRRRGAALPATPRCSAAAT